MANIPRSYPNYDEAKDGKKRKINLGAQKSLTCKTRSTGQWELKGIWGTDGLLGFMADGRG